MEMESGSSDGIRDRIRGESPRSDDMLLSSSSVIVAAERQTDCAINELGETNRTFQACLEILGAINHHGKGSENRRLETSPKSRVGRSVLT
ncbi:hypothetical protein TIFTF001_006123 [Ficus carica]|uniref:Uncharacterized protein n=1 Tax=Ficus carica TaxID=3494 RepID=A0AA88A9S1_FICCA|nr:hypothetical protein TIFTF001_006123 [Ficus carica]